MYLSQKMIRVSVTRIHFENEGRAFGLPFESNKLILEMKRRLLHFEKPLQTAKYILTQLTGTEIA